MIGNASAAFVCAVLTWGLGAVSVREWRAGKRVDSVLTAIQALVGVALALWLVCGAAP